jgi:hypothetical protein
MVPSVKAKLLLLAVVTIPLAGCGASGIARTHDDARPGHARASESTGPMTGVLVYAKFPAHKEPPTGKESVWKAGIDGGHPKLLARHATDPTVSPDGRLVAYDSLDHQNVLVVPTAGGKPRIVYRTGAFPTWAPDSRHLAVYVGRALVIVDIRTGHTNSIETSPSTLSSPSISFSPDSTRVAYSTEDRTGSDLYVSSIDGGRPVQITHDHRSEGPVWGPNGIAFVRLHHRNDWHNDIWLTGPRPNDAHQLTHMNSYVGPVAFSGNGKELLASYPAMHNGQLIAVDVPSGHTRPITPSIGDLNAQGLSTDGKTVLASIGCGGTPSPYGILETIPFAGGKPHVIVHGPCSGSWYTGR